MISGEVDIYHMTNHFHNGFLSLMSNPNWVWCHQLKMVFSYSING